MPSQTRQLGSTGSEGNSRGTQCSSCRALAAASPALASHGAALRAHMVPWAAAALPTPRTCACPNQERTTRVRHEAARQLSAAGRAVVRPKQPRRLGSSPAPRAQPQLAAGACSGAVGRPADAAAAGEPPRRPLPPAAAAARLTSSPHAPHSLLCTTPSLQDLTLADTSPEAPADAAAVLPPLAALSPADEGGSPFAWQQSPAFGASAGAPGLQHSCSSNQLPAVLNAGDALDPATLTAAAEAAAGGGGGGMQTSGMPTSGMQTSGGAAVARAPPGPASVMVLASSPTAELERDIEMLLAGGFE